MRFQNDCRDYGLGSRTPYSPPLTRTAVDARADRRANYSKLNFVRAAERILYLMRENRFPSYEIIFNASRPPRVSEISRCHARACMYLHLYTSYITSPPPRAHTRARARACSNKHTLLTPRVGSVLRRVRIVNDFQMFTLRARQHDGNFTRADNNKNLYMRCLFALRETVQKTKKKEIQTVQGDKVNILYRIRDGKRDRKNHWVFFFYIEFPVARAYLPLHTSWRRCGLHNAQEDCHASYISLSLRVPCFG